MMKTYMDIDIGCAEIYQHQQEAYKLAVEFLNSVGQQFGWPARTEDLSEEAKELVHEVFANDPVWSSKVVDLDFAPLGFQYLLQSCFPYDS